MSRWEVEDERIHIKNELLPDLTLGTSNWITVSQDYARIDPFDGILTGFASGLYLPLGAISIKELNTNEFHYIGDLANEFAFSIESPLIIVDLGVELYIRIKSRATIRKSVGQRRISITSDSLSPVMIAIRSQYSYLSDPITIPPEPADLAAAISYTHCSHDVTTPDRSHSTYRRHPPMIQIGDERNIPQSIQESTFNSEIELCVPNTLESVFTIAPLAHYLQAKLTVKENATPILSVPSTEIDRELGSDMEFQHDVAAMLRQIFFLDCLVRNSTNEDSQLLDKFSIDPLQVYYTTPAKRLKEYLSIPYSAIKPALPEWHLSMYVDPTIDNIPSLPFMLHDLALIYQAETTTLDERELLKRSLDDFFRTDNKREDSESVTSLNTVKPELHAGSIHGWLAKETPIDAFKVIPEAYQNRLDNIGDQRRIASISVILNDSEMAEEHLDVTEIYQNCTRALPLRISIRRNVTRSELAKIFKESNDLVHYIGHCDDSGLRCRNGNLAVENIEECNTDSAFLNACGSFHEGMELIRKGVKAAAVTSTQVLNKQAATVGRTFAQLLINGFCVAHAMKLAHRQIMMGKNYLVLGDGTYTLTQRPENPILTLELEKEDDDWFRVTCKVFCPRDPGGIHKLSIDGKEFQCTSGTNLEFRCNLHHLQTYLDQSEVPVFYNNEMYWSSELAEKFVSK